MVRSAEVDVRQCTRCPDLCASRTQIVNSVGTLDAELVFVGEAPGEQEDRQGEPFVGRSGEILTAALRDRGLSRQDVRIVNSIRCRPPDNRNPTSAELANCRPYLERELRTINPQLLVTLGKVPSEHLLDRDVAVTAEAGSVQEATIGGSVFQILVCIHPAATLYDPSQRDRFMSTLDRAIDLTSPNSGQANLDEF